MRACICTVEHDGRRRRCDECDVGWLEPSNQFGDMPNVSRKTGGMLFRFAVYVPPSIDIIVKTFDYLHILCESHVILQNDHTTCSYQYDFMIFARVGLGYFGTISKDTRGNGMPINL